MASTTLQKVPSLGAVIFRYLIKKADAQRYLPKLVHGFLKFNAAGELTADQDLEIVGKIKRSPSATPANITTAGAGTYTAANLAVGVITRDPSGANRTDTTDTAANLISGLGLTANYQEVQCLVVNTADQAETITLAGGTNVTLKGTITIERDTAVRLSILRTGASSVTIRQS